jgi:hypothetical protein
MGQASNRPQNRYGSEFVTNAPKTLTDHNVTVTLEYCPMDRLATLIEGDRAGKPRREDVPVVIVNYRGRDILIDGGHRITQWRQNGDTTPHKAFVAAVR